MVLSTRTRTRPFVANQLISSFFRLTDTRFDSENFLSEERKGWGHRESFK